MQNGVAVTGLAGRDESDQIFTFDVPDNNTLLDFSLGQGTGDVDLFVRHDTIPTDNAYDCRSHNAGTTEACTQYGGGAGHWYVKVHGAESFPFSFSGVSLQATYANPTTLRNRAIVHNLSGTAGSEQFYAIHVPANQKKLVVKINGKKPGANVYVRLGDLPSPVVDNCLPTASPEPSHRNLHDQDPVPVLVLHRHLRHA